MGAGAGESVGAARSVMSRICVASWPWGGQRRGQTFSCHLGLGRESGREAGLRGPMVELY